MEPPTNKQDLKNEHDHVLINLKGQWRVQKTVRKCNRSICWELVTEKPYNKIHALKRCEGINFHNCTVYAFKDNAEWQVINKT